MTNNRPRRYCPMGVKDILKERGDRESLLGVFLKNKRVLEKKGA